MLKIFNKIKTSVLIAGVALMSLASCNDYLDVVPDGGDPTLDDAFNLRSTAIRYRGTCYSYMQKDGFGSGDPALLGGDELWDLYPRTTQKYIGQTMTMIARGLQSKSNVYGNDWDHYFTAIRDCDNLIDNVDKVPDMTDEEKAQWKAEGRFLKAYYHFCLIRKWGAIPITKHSLPMDASVEEVRVYRDPIDSCFNFVLDEIDKAIPYLSESFDESEYGYVTKAAAAAMKARVACYAASPLFNGNEDQKNLVDKRGVQLFPAKTEEQKLERWKYAMQACKDAIDECEKVNIKLYTGQDITLRLGDNDTLKTDLILRGTLCQPWNTELIWGNTQLSWGSSERQYCQMLATVDLQAKTLGMSGPITGYRCVGVPLKIAEEFYTKHGVPITVDRDRQNGWNELDIVRGDEAHKYYIEKGYETVKLNFDREPRFYAYLGFDGGKWLGQLPEATLQKAPGQLSPEDIFDVECRNGKYANKLGGNQGPVTGYFPKRTIPYQNRVSGNAGTNVSTTFFPYPIIRLTDLYLLYAEAINEVEGPNGPNSAEMFKCLNDIRERAHIPDVKTAWDEYSTNPGYYSTQAGMRAIIHQDRMNEMAFESQRFWDLRRWKEAPAEYSKNIYGFNLNASDPTEYYKKTLVFEQPFLLRDYFWPISTSIMEHNPNLIQNTGW